ncbi:hypothetical protein [Neptunicella marina]|uniref:Uncharacterized protein n=1 Tax=Neptunicella marina TaxID=2125989 RepID=A0A8J6M2T0_9ALTE|nr:hypothetical protein [Neptunicella marina]MBC3766462.1 hypothetical protein [Neptunicella marina]
MNSLSKEIKDIFIHGEFNFDEGYLEVKNIQEQDFYNAFPRKKYESSLYEKGHQFGSIKIEDIDFIFEDYHQLIRYISSDNEEKTSEEVVVLSQSKNLIDIKNQYINLKKWIEFFDFISVHKYPKSDRNDSWAYIFFDKKSKNTSTVLDFDIGEYSEVELREAFTNISDPSLLLGSVLQEDAHQGEKVSIMRASLIQMEEENNIGFLEFIKFSNELLNLFHINYETYLRSFSFEDFIKELEEDVGDFINKIEEQIQGFYIQALAVPGAVILASALRVANKSLNLALIFSTLLAFFILYRSMTAKKKFIKRMAENTITRLEIYEKRSSEINNSYAKDAISEKVKSAKNSIITCKDDSLKDIKGLVEKTVGIFIMYVISAVVFNSG